MPAYRPNNTAVNRRVRTGEVQWHTYMVCTEERVEEEKEEKE